MSTRMHRLPALCVALTLAGVVACSSHTSDTAAAEGAPTCGFTSAPPVAPPDDAGPYYDPNFVPQGTSTQSYVTAQALLGLDTLIGSYLRGAATIYTGTLEAHDDQSVLGADCPGDGGNIVPCANQSIASGPAVASLTTIQGVAALTVHSLSAHKYVLFQQAGDDAGPDGGIPAGATAVGLVLPDENAGGNSGTCSGCAASFANAPPAISLENLVATTEVPDLDASVPDAAADAAVSDANQEAYLRTYASTSLTRATPCQLTWEDLVELNALTPANAPSLGSFSLQGGQWVAVSTGNVTTESDAGDYCGVSYTLEFYVNASNLADYGVRNFKTFVPDASDGYEGCYQ